MLDGTEVGGWGCGIGVGVVCHRRAKASTFIATGNERGCRLVWLLRFVAMAVVGGNDHSPVTIHSGATIRTHKFSVSTFIGRRHNSIPINSIS